MTGGFRFSNTRPRTLRVAADLNAVPPAGSAAWACDLISPQMRSAVCTKTGSPCWLSRRGRGSAIGTVSSTSQPLRRHRSAR